MNNAENLDIYRIYDNFRYEVIGGKIFFMSPPALPIHGRVSNGLARIFDRYFEKIGCKKCRVYNDASNLDIKEIQKQKNIKLPDKCEKDFYIPDVMVICDKNIDTKNGVIGAPKLLVEVSSRKTAKYDRTTKKEVYEAIGVEEYWIVSPQEKTIEIYILKDNKYFLWNVYEKLDKKDIKGMERDNEYIKEDKQPEIITEFSPYSFPDMIIELAEVFEDFDSD